MARRPVIPLLPLAEAQERLLAPVRPLGSETAPVEAAAGRYLAAPLSAARTQPAADLSAMDGYAVCGNGPWTLLGESAAGRPSEAALAPGQATQISTGAVLPHGADAVLIREDAQLDAGILRSATDDGPSARHVRRAGFDFGAGDPLIAAGERIGPAQLALAIMGGAATLEVGRRPTLAVIDTGDELRAPGAARLPHELPASNGPMLEAMCAPLAARITRRGPVPDDRAALRAAIEDARGADVIVTTGGASVGEHDLVRPVLQEAGAQIDFWRVAIRPGKPLIAGRRGEQFVLGLPGNPVSAYVTAVLFLLPLLRRLSGAADPLPRFIPAILDGDMRAGGPRQEFVRGRFTARGITPIAERDSSALRAMASADGLIERAIDAPEAQSGQTVRIILTNA